MRVRTRRSAVALAVLVTSATLVATGAIAGPGMQGAADRPWELSGEQVQDNRTDHNASTSLNVTVGAQLSTVIETQARDVHTDVEDTGFTVAYERGDRESAVADRFDELRERAAEVRANYDDLEAASEAGDVTRREYARRLASLHDEAEQLRQSLRRVRFRANDLSTAARADAGLDDEALSEISEDLEAVAGTGHRALLARYTGHGNGHFEFDLDAGIRIEATNDEGEGIRSIRRSGDDSRELTVGRTAALETAREALSPERNWTLEGDRLDEINGKYHFEFELRTDDAAGGADVSVDGSSGEVVDLEEGVLGLDHDRTWWSAGDHWDDSDRGSDAESDENTESNAGDDRNLPDWLDDRPDWLDDHPDWADDREDGENTRDGWLDERPRTEGRNSSPEERSDSHNRSWLDPDRDRDWFDDRNDSDGTDVTATSDGFWNRDTGDGRGEDEDGGDESGHREEATDDPDHAWADRHVDEDEGIDVTVVDGQVASGEPITLAVRVDGNATAGVPVAVGGDHVAETTEDGTATVTLPDDTEDLVISVEWDDRRAVLTYEFEPDERGLRGR